MGKGGVVNRVEPSRTQYAIAHAKVSFQITGLFNFTMKFSGHNFGVGRAFS